MTNDISKEIANILDDYSDKAVRKIEQAEKTAADLVVRELKANAPRDKGKTGYQSSFAKKKTGSGKNTTYTIYSKKPGMTHLLENGHAIANQYGRQGGRTRGTKHWAPAEQAGIEKFEREVRRELEG